MRKYVILIILGLIVFSLLGCEGETIVLPGDQYNQIRVAGTATVKAAPDIATVEIGVQTFNEEVEAAVAENNRKSDDIISALKANGIAESDIQTSRFNIYPQRDYWDEEGRNEIIGYQVDNMVSVTIRNLDSVGEVLQEAVDAGANNIYGVNFTLDDPSSLRDTARVEAVKDARQRAEVMAEAAEIELGDVTSITEMSYGGPIIAREEYDSAVAKGGEMVPIEPGELELTIQVEVTFAIDE